MSGGEFVCSECGSSHALPTFGWDYPMPVLNVPFEERDERVQWSPDECVIDRRDFFLRGCVEIPVKGQAVPFIWGVWAQVPPDAFQGHHEYKDGGQADRASLKGTDMEITYAGRWSRRDHFAIDRAASRVFGRGSVFKTTAGFLFAAVILIVFAIFAAGRGSSDAATQWLLVALIPAALFTVNIIGIYRAYSRHPFVGVPIHGVFSESGFELCAPHAETRIAWPAIARTGTSADYLLLETTTQELYAFPRAFFSSAHDFASACSIAASACSIAQQGVSGRPAAPLVHWRRVLTLSAILLATTVIYLFWALLRPAG